MDRSDYTPTPWCCAPAGTMRRASRRCWTRSETSAAAAYDHQDYPFDQLVQDLNPPRDPSRNPLFDVMLVLQNTANDRLAPAGAPRLPRWPSTTA